MAMRKLIRNSISAIMVLLLIVFSSCDKKNENSVLNDSSTELLNISNTGINTTAVGFSDLEIPAHIEDSRTQNDISVVINADVEVPEIESLYQVACCFDEDNLNQIVNEWFLTSYPNAEMHADESVDFGWIDTDSLAYMSGNKEGKLYYTDPSRDISGPIEEYDHLFEYGYITDDIPLGMIIDSSKAEQEAISFITRFTPFEYKAYNILSIDDKQRNIGFYEVNLQASLNGIPICIEHSGDDSFYLLDFKACISSDGIFDFQGNVNLKISDEQPVETLVDFKEIEECFLSDIFVLATGTDIMVDRVYLSYVPTKTILKDSEDVKWLITLTPAWCFECKESRIEEGQEINMQYTIAYNVENGRIIGKIY